MPLLSKLRVDSTTVPCAGASTHPAYVSMEKRYVKYQHPQQHPTSFILKFPKFFTDKLKIFKENLLPHLNAESRCIISDDSSGFMHVNLHPHSQQLCGIHLGDEHFVFNSMPFGLTTGI